MIGYETGYLTFANTECNYLKFSNKSYQLIMSNLILSNFEEDFDVA